MPVEVQPTIQELTGAIRSLANGKAVKRTEFLLSYSRSAPTVILPCARDCSILSYVFGGGPGAAAVEIYHHHGTPLKVGPDGVRHFAGSASREDTAGDHHSPPERVLRVRGDPAGGTEWFTTEPFYHGYDDFPLKVCYIDHTKAYDSVDRTLVWTVFTRFGVSQNIISVIRQFHDCMQACVRLDDRVRSGLLLFCCCC